MKKTDRRSVPVPHASIPGEAPQRSWTAFRNRASAPSLRSAASTADPARRLLLLKGVQPWRFASEVAVFLGRPSFLILPAAAAVASQPPRRPDSPKSPVECGPIIRTGLTTQPAYHGDPPQAPRMTEDGAMVLVDQDLVAQGSSATCRRAEVRAAIDFVTNPLVGLLVKDDADASIVILVAD